MTKRTRKHTKPRRRTDPVDRTDLGDIPKPMRRTYTTSSCPLPRVSDHCVQHGTSSSVLTATATSNVASNYQFALTGSNLAASGYDQYRYCAVRFSVVPQNNAIGLVTNSTTALVPLYCVIDYDDGTNLTSSAQALGYNNCIQLNPGESCSRVFKPRMAIGAYTGSFGGFANVSPMWCDAASSGILHYGIKIFIPGTTASQTLLQSWDIVLEHFIEFRNNV